MVLKELVDASLGCFHFGAYHASFLLALCATDATAKKRFPNECSVGRRFKDFVQAHMPQLFGAQNFWVAVDMPEDRSAFPLDANGVHNLPQVGDDFNRDKGKPRLVLMQGVLYHAFRCALSHEADLPDVELLPPTPNGAVAVKVDTKVRISADIIGRLLFAVVHAQENQGLFGTQEGAIQAAATPKGAASLP
ncbi:MAG: hypothetical protein HRU71_12770 [Planctomycetia bacterium]|nr:MAG: hypothetical protein HRU71_12770 [Planctomycetia bacterium]